MIACVQAKVRLVWSFGVSSVNVGEAPQPVTVSVAVAVALYVRSSLPDPATRVAAFTT